MQSIDPSDLSSQQHTDELLKKSRALKERSKTTNNNLNTLKENADKMKQDSDTSETIGKEKR